MVNQTVQTPEQQHWLTKLLRFDFDIVYKPSSDNGPANALSRLHESSWYTLQAITKPVIAIITALKEFYKQNPTSLALLQSIIDQLGAHPYYSVKD